MGTTWHHIVDSCGRRLGRSGRLALPAEFGRQSGVLERLGHWCHLVRDADRLTNRYWDLHVQLVATHQKLNDGATQAETTLLSEIVDLSEVLIQPHGAADDLVGAARNRQSKVLRQADTMDLPDR